MILILWYTGYMTLVWQVSYDTVVNQKGRDVVTGAHWLVWNIYTSTAVLSIHRIVHAAVFIQGEMGYSYRTAQPPPPPPCGVCKRKLTKHRDSRGCGTFP